MPRQAATTGSLPRAFEGVKEMQADGAGRGEGCRPCPGGRSWWRRGSATTAGKEIIDFQLAGSESAAERERFLDRPYHRGLTGEGLGMILRRWRQGPARRPAGRPARHPRPEVPGAQDPRSRPLQDPCRAKAGRDHQRRRTTVPRGPQMDTAHGNLPGPDLDGPHPPRGLRPRRQVAGNRYPILPDT